MMNTAKTVEAILNKEDKAVDHIIRQNVALNDKVNELQDTIKDTNNEKEELEHELDGITKSKNILQGYTKNFHEMNKNERELRELYSKSYMTFKRMYNIILINALMFYPMLYSIPNTIYRHAYLTLYIGLLMMLVYKVNQYDTNKLQRIKQLNENLQTLYKATDMVSDLMDSL